MYIEQSLSHTWPAQCIHNNLGLALSDEVRAPRMRTYGTAAASFPHLEVFVNEKVRGLGHAEFSNRSSIFILSTCTNPFHILGVE